MTDLGPDQRPEGWNLVPSAHDTMVAPFTALFAHDALRLANVGPGRRVLDVGAGTGFSAWPLPLWARKCWRPISRQG